MAVLRTFNFAPGKISATPEYGFGNCSSTIAPALFYYLPSMAVCVTLITHIPVGIAMTGVYMGSQ